MICVIDASVAIKWFVAEELRDHAIDLLDDPEQLAAPDFLLLEVSQIVWKKTRRREIDGAQAKLIVSTIAQIIPSFYRTADLSAHALDIALDLKHSAYDCLYLACTALNPDSVLVTADAALCRAIAGTGHASRVRYLGSLPPWAAVRPHRDPT